MSPRRVTAREQIFRSVTEKDLQQGIVDELRARGWLVYHPYDSRRSEPGYPDLVCVRGRRLVFVEIKRETGQLTPEQSTWIKALIHAKEVSVSIVRPSNRNGFMEGMK